MGLKGWFENKLAARKAQQEQRKMIAQSRGRYIPNRRSSNHDASKKGYHHEHGAGFLTKFVYGGKTIYKHGRTFGKTIPSNHERVVNNRNAKQKMKVG